MNTDKLESLKRALKFNGKTTFSHDGGICFMESFLDELQSKISSLESENKTLKEKEIRGDRMIVDLEHKKTVLESDRERLLSALKEERSLLWAWIGYSSNGGWSTHLNESMKTRIEAVDKLITEIESK